MKRCRECRHPLRRGWCPNMVDPVSVLRSDKRRFYVAVPKSWGWR